jgi:ectoine hydroxylase-related dioxygenase (phytanoyl-CoA dioxygenase family)
MGARRLSEHEIRHYREHGYVVVAELIDEAALAAVDRELARLLDGARGRERSDEVYDLEDSHGPERPRARRIKQPHQHCPAVDALLRSAEIVGIVGQLVGPDIRLQGSKLNMKAAGYGAPVEWHQDWAFYPHTNADVLAVGVMLDDVTEDNGPLMVLPGTNKGPVYDHHDNGTFCGAMNLRAAGLDPARAVRLTGRRGSISIHHALTVHGSDLNRSGTDRRLLLFELTAADAWPLAGTATKFTGFAEFTSRIIAGEQTLAPRLEPVPVRIPQPQPPTVGSIYEFQKAMSERQFGTYEDEPAEIEG